MSHTYGARVSTALCPRCGRMLWPDIPHLCATIDSIKGGKIMTREQEAEWTEECEKAEELSTHYHNDEERIWATAILAIKNRLVLLEDVAAAAKAWDETGNWREYRTLHVALVKLDEFEKQNH